MAENSNRKRVKWVGGLLVGGLFSPIVTSSDLYNALFSKKSSLGYQRTVEVQSSIHLPNTEALPSGKS